MVAVVQRQTGRGGYNGETVACGEEISHGIYS